MSDGLEHGADNDIPPRSTSSGQQQTQTETIQDESSHVSQTDPLLRTADDAAISMDMEITSGEYGRPSDALIIEQRNQIR